MPDLTQQVADIEAQINILRQQYADLVQQSQEDPQRQASCEEVAEAVQDNTELVNLGVTVIPADQGSQIHPDYVYLVLPLTAPWDKVEKLRGEFLRAGGVQGNKPERIYIHRENAIGVIST